jgi:hypothetical protein
LKQIVSIILSLTVSMLGACASIKTDNEAASQEKVQDFSANGEKPPTSINEKEKSHLSFPPKISLVFQTVKGHALEEMQMDGLLLKETFEFGELEEDPIYIEIYTDSLNDTYGVLSYKNHQYQLFYQASHAEEETLVKPVSFDKSDRLMGMFTYGMVGKYIVFDKSVNKWFSLPAWPTREMIDLDHDGIMEVVEQIQNHNDFSNVAITRWNEDQLERTTLKEAFQDHLMLDSNHQRLSVEYHIENDQVKMVVRVIGNEEIDKEYSLKDYALEETD